MGEKGQRAKETKGLNPYSGSQRTGCPTEQAFRELGTQTSCESNFHIDGRGVMKLENEEGGKASFLECWSLKGLAPCSPTQAARGFPVQGGSTVVPGAPPAGAGAPPQLCSLRLLLGAGKEKGVRPLAFPNLLPAPGTELRPQSQCDDPVQSREEKEGVACLGGCTRPHPCPFPAFGG